MGRGGTTTRCSGACEWHAAGTPPFRPRHCHPNPSRPSSGAAGTPRRQTPGSTPQRPSTTGAGPGGNTWLAQPAATAAAARTREAGLLPVLSRTRICRTRGPLATPTNCRSVSTLCREGRALEGAPLSRRRSRRARRAASDMERIGQHHRGDRRACIAFFFFTRIPAPNRWRCS